MKQVLVLALALLLPVAYPTILRGKGKTVRITIKAHNLRTPIAITDPDTLAPFNVWAGPGTSSNERQSLIVDWAKGPVAHPSANLPRYTVSFYSELQTERLVYVVLYVFDASAGQGYVYVPGRQDSFYALNVSTILHGNEGNWFRSWSAWDAVAKPLLVSATQAGQS